MINPPEGRDVTISLAAEVDVTPATEVPSSALLATPTIPCTGSESTFVSVTLEIELAIGKTDFTEDLEQALTTALDGRYILCDPRRRLSEKSTLHPKTRMSQDSILLSPVVVRDTEQSCITKDTSASSCRVAIAEMQAFGTDSSESVVASIESIAKDDTSFDTTLIMKGIVAVRVVEKTNQGNNIEASSATTTSVSKATVRSSHTVMAVVLSVAALTLVIVVIVRRGARRRRHLLYGPTMEKTYSENQCLGIQPRDSFENSSDNETFYSPRVEHPQAASFLTKG
jgi:hypothetical protein